MRSSAPGERVEAGQPIGWTCEGTWHVHLGERAVGADGRRRWINPLRRDGKLHPYVDRADPRIHEIRFYTPAKPHWGLRRRGNVVRLPPAGRRLDKDRLAGTSTCACTPTTRSRSSAGSQTCRGSPRRIIRSGSRSSRCTSAAASSSTGERSSGRIASPRCPSASTSRPAPTRTCPRTAACASTARSAATASTGSASFREPYWDTTRFANGRYRLRVRAWDIAGNSVKLDSNLTIKN